MRCRRLPAPGGRHCVSILNQILGLEEVRALVREKAINGYGCAYYDQWMIKGMRCGFGTSLKNGEKVKVRTRARHIRGMAGDYCAMVALIGTVWLLLLRLFQHYPSGRRNGWN